MHEPRRYSDRTPAAGPPKRIGELLLKEGLITPSQLQDALDKQRTDGGKIVENLIALEYLDTQTFVRFLSRQPGMASIDLLNYTIPADVVRLIDREFAIKHQIVPIDKMGRDLTVGMACPLDAATVAALEEKTGMKVRPLLVSMNDVRVALDNYYRRDDEKKETFTLDGNLNVPLSARVVTPGTASISLVESGLKFEKVVHLIRQISSLPALPETVNRVRHAMDDVETSTDDMAKIISNDPSLAAKVVSLANSAAYSFTHRVDTIERATALLGLREVYGAVLASAVIDYFKEGKHFNHKKFWKRSMACATACKLIAKARRVQGVSGLFAAGLMFDIGRAVLAEIAPKQYAEVDQELPEDEIIRIENELFGLAHPEVGFLLADGWGLPAEISEPIRFHHDFQQAQKSPKLVAIVALGALLSDLAGKADRHDLQVLAGTHQVLLEVLGLELEQLCQIYDETVEAVKRQQAGN
ncbi:MAG: HDOD domain-containing protein [Candidatus Hydrogenedentes bacterium]|nr:HDOD domain-containing protein [Candidatus Hydrogenedentota bacterium]